jgi:PAS domain S-box-containing protein
VQPDHSKYTPGGHEPVEPIECSGAAAFIFQDGVIRYVNPATEALTGYSAQELLRMSFWEVIHPDQREFLQQRALARRRGEAVPWHSHIKLVRKGGETVWVEFSTGTIEFEGRPAVLGAAVDASERRAVAERLRESEHRLRALIEHSSDMVLIAEADGRMRYIGPSIQRILGFRPEALVGLDGLRLIHPGDRERVTTAYGAMARRPGSRAIAAYRIQHRDGTWRWLESIGTNLLDDPTIGGIIVNSRDITERVEAETAYRSLVDNSLQGLVIIQEGRIVFANRAATDVTGYTNEELLAFGLEAQRATIHAEDAPAVWERWERRMAGEPLPPRTEFRMVRKDGAVRWVEAYATEIEYRGGPAVQIAHVDITDRKRAEEEARRHQQELAHVLRRRTMGEMAAVLAHEVNQPLSAIASYARGCALRLRTDKGASDLVLTALDEIAAQAMRASEIIRRLRGFVGKSDLRRRSVQLNDLVEEMIRFVAAEARERRVLMQVQLASELPLLEVDALQIEQVILNLLRNALDAMYESPGDPPLLIVSTRTVGGAAEVAVRDSGAGLRADVAAEIFEPFVTSKPDGLGMGLSICRSIIDAHGGRLWATSNPDRGMTFRFTLPLSAALAQLA